MLRYFPRVLRYYLRVLRYFPRVLAFPVPAQRGQLAAPARVLRYNPRVLRYFLRVVRAEVEEALRIDLHSSAPC